MVLPRLLILDLDGTTVRSDGRVSERTREAIGRARSAGIGSLVATARPPRSLDGVLRELDLLGPTICISGALVFDFDTRSTLRHVTLAHEIVARAVEGGRVALPGIAFAAEVDHDFRYEPTYTPARTPPDGSLRAPVEEWGTRPVSKLLARHPSAEPYEIVDALRSGLDGEAFATHSGDRFAEVVDADATKVAAAAWYCRTVGVRPEEVVAFGDSPIDLPLFGWAGSSVAVANAAPEVRRAASRIIPSNDEDGVAIEIERLLT